jgi:hypothetical protein
MESSNIARVGAGRRDAYTPTQAETLNALCAALTERLADLGKLIRQQNDMLSTMTGMLLDHLHAHPQKRSCIDSFKTPPDDPDAYLYGRN